MMSLDTIVIFPGILRTHSDSFEPYQHILYASQSRTPFKTAWKGHVFQTPVGLGKSQSLQTIGQSLSIQALVEVTPKRQALETIWQGHILQAAVETITLD